MEIYNLKSVPILHSLQAVLREFSNDHAETVAAYVFGSLATGKERAGSDIDIALITNKRISGLTKIDWETELSNAIGKDVDLVIFNQAGVLMRHQILKYGKLIFNRDDRLRIKEEVMARKEYLDIRYLFKEMA